MTNDAFYTLLYPIVQELHAKTLSKKENDIVLQRLASLASKGEVNASSSQKVTKIHKSKLATTSKK